MQKKKDNPFRKTRYYFLAAAILIGIPQFFGFYSGQTGRVLVATQETANDPNFSQRVVYVFYNGLWGAQGIVINDPLSGDLAEEIEEDKELGSYDLFKGGPVAFPDYRTVALNVPSKASRWRTQPLTVAEFNNYKVFRDALEEAGQEAKLPKEGNPLPLYFGFAGWITGQLEAELRHGVWRVLECKNLDFPGIRSSDLWEHLSGDLEMTSCKSKN